MKIRWIWFDLGYTLLYLHREEPFRQILLKRGFDRPLEEIEKAFHLTDKHFMRTFPGALGKIPGSYIPWYHGQLLYSLGIHTDLCELYAEWQKSLSGPLKSWHPYSFVPEVLSQLQNEGYHLGIISNWDDSARKILDKHELSPYFESVIISSEKGFEKPHRDLFLAALESVKALAEESLYVGDNFYDDFVGSTGAGMKCHIINRFGSLGIEELPECTIIPDIRSLVPLLSGKNKAFKEEVSKNKTEI